MHLKRQFDLLLPVAEVKILVLKVINLLNEQKYIPCEQTDDI